MKFIPKLISLDFETTGLEFYRDDFRIISLAASWRNEKGEMTSVYYDTAKHMETFLKRLSELQTPLLVFNATFEHGCLETQYPDLKFNIAVDAMRLGQLYDGGGPLKKKKFGLKELVKRVIPERADYEKEIYDWVRENVPGVKRGKEGGYLASAPKDILRRYNEADTETTLLLYEIFTAKFEAQNFDWKVDHELYLSSVRLVVEAKIAGIKVNTEKLKKCIDDIECEVVYIDHTFKKQHSEAILVARELLRQKAQAKYKKKIVSELPEFNITSKQHLEFLFVKALGQKAKLTAPKGGPSFKAAHMKQWEGAELLANRGQRLIVKKQAQSLLEKAEYDSRWHPDLRLVATATGRAAGGGGLNVQGLSRKDKGLMSCLEADEGYTLVSIDFSAGEPSITSHYSKDKRYRYATYEGVGKEPYFDKDVLMIDDIYLMYSSVAPYSKDEILKAWKKTYNGNSFSQQWMLDSEVIKKDLKKIRNLTKTICLGLAYSMGPKTLQKNLIEKEGTDFGLLICKETYKKYWRLFNGVKRFADAKKDLLNLQGFLITEFGFILYPNSDHKAFNAYIQGSLGSLIQLFSLLLKLRAPYMKFQANIHDELVVQVPTALLDQFKRDKEAANEDFNEELSGLDWSIPMRTGFVAGNNWYEAK